MEFFEKAHVVKDQEASSSNLSKENVKKQLKQMLHGYKQSDINLIKTSAVEQTKYENDSTSVSGYSDLNLTSSGDESDSSPELDSSPKPDSSPEQGLNEDNNLPNNTDLSSRGKVIFNEAFDCKVNEDLDSIIGEFNSDSTELSSLKDSEASIVSGMLESVSESNSSEPFDADGELAAKILRRLAINNAKNQKLKRKHEAAINDCSILVEDNSRMKSVKKQENRPLLIEEYLTEKPSEPLIMEEYLIEKPSIRNCATEKDSYTFSPPYVSITAIDVPLQSFNDILGEYKHRTVNNIKANHDAIKETNNDFTAEENMSVDIQTEADVGSLTPEPSLNNEIGEIEEIINLDSTIDSQETTTDLPLNDTIQSEPVSDGESSTDEDYYKVLDTYKLYYGHKCCIVILKHPTELFIQGKVSIRVLDGSIDIFGYTPKDETCDLYAPFYSFAQSIKTIDKENDFSGLFGKLTAAGLSVTEAEDIVITIGDRDGVILLKPLVNKCMDFVENNFKTTNLFVNSIKNVEPFFTKATNTLNCSLFSVQPERCFKVHPSWKQAVKHSEEKQSRGIICGGKGTGKSTFLRYQVNNLISKGPILVVDLDPGQCEFTVAGSISATIVTDPLFGPNFTHLTKPDIMLNIGMINTMENPKRYIAAVQQLISLCCNNDAYMGMPWIINTMGMTNYLGLKFITLIIILTQPTYLLQYESKNSKRRFETFLRPHNVKLLYQDYENDPLFRNISYPEGLDYLFVVADETDSVLKNGYALSPKDERFLSFLAYFSQLIKIYGQNNLLAITPYQVNLKDIAVATNVIVKEEYITKVINGQIVALCQLARQCDSRVFTLADKPLLCHGHGIVRGIDWEKEVLYVITPVEGSLLGSVDTLLYVDWSPESMGQEAHLPTGTFVPYRTNARYTQRQLMSTPRRRFNPLQLIKMTRNS